MVTPGDPSCCLASSSATNRTRFRHRMVRLAPLPPSRSLQGPPETEAATVMLGRIRGFSGCGFETIAGLQVALGLERVDLVGGDGRDDVNEGIDDGSMLGQIEG